MGREKKQSTRVIRSLALLALAIAFTLVISIRTGFASRGLQPLRNVVAQIFGTETPYPTVTPVPTEEGLFDLYSLDGEAIAQWSSAEAVTSFKVTAYQIEELTLPHPMEVTLDGETVDVDKTWRITITGTGFPVLSLGYYIWIDDISVPAAETAPGLVGFVFEPSMLREGAKLGMSYTDWIGLRQQLPVGLDLKKNPAP